MQPRPPREPVAWQRWVEQMLTQFDVDIKRLQITTPQIPDPEAGVAFTGPLAPYHWVGPGRFGASGSPMSGTRVVSGAASGPGGTGGSVNTGAGCSEKTCNSYGTGGQLQISGVTGACASDFNGNFSDLTLDSDCNPRTYTRNAGLWIITVSVTTTPSANPPVTVFLDNGSGQVTATFSGVACPGQNSTLTFVSQSALGGCAGTDLSAATVQLNLHAV